VISLNEASNSSTAKTASESLEIEKNIEKYFLPKIFSGYDELTKLKQGDTSKIAQRVRSLMIGGKSEEIFTDAKFLKEQFDRYQQILKKINVKIACFCVTNFLTLFGLRSRIQKS